jgi:hypothetical protein
VDSGCSSHQGNTLVCGSHSASTIRLEATVIESHRREIVLSDEDLAPIGHDLASDCGRVANLYTWICRVMGCPVLFHLTSNFHGGDKPPRARSWTQ